MKVEVAFPDGGKFGRANVKTSWCFVVVKVMGIFNDGSIESSVDDHVDIGLVLAARPRAEAVG